MMFRDRTHAARLMLPYLEKYKGKDVVVLAIPRGGVPVGLVIAEHFDWELSVLLTKKIGHPMNKEYAIGAVSLDSMMVDRTIADVPQRYIEEEVARIRKLLEERRDRFIGRQPPVVLKNKTVIVVDDGIATGYTMKASVQMLRKQNPAEIVIAVPVASPRILPVLEKLVDDLIVLQTPEEFMGVGQFYEDFSEVTDEDVVEYLNRHKSTNG